MAIEIERKFLVASDAWRAESFLDETIRQGYLARAENVTIRVRVIDSDHAVLTIKSREQGPIREEFEYAIPIADAEALLARCTGTLIEKVRHSVAFSGRTWTIDEFRGDRAGLILAECELGSVDDALDLPPWTGEEVTNDPAYRNEAL